MTTYRLLDGVAGRPGVGSSGTQPPATPTSFTGGYVAGTAYKVTGTAWLQGYWWWVASGQATAAQKFCIWSENIDGAGHSASVIPSSVVTSGTLAAGMNFVPLPSPIPLTRGWSYIAATGMTSTGAGFPLSNAQWGSGDPYSAGIVNGLLTAFSHTSGSRPDPFGSVQSCFSIAGSDPTVAFPASDDGAFLSWLDVQVTDQAPAGATYRLFPSLEGWGLGNSLDFNAVQDDDGYAVGNTVSLSAPCSPVRLWFLSGQGAQVLPSRCAVWDTTTQAVVAGTDKTSPAWKAEGGGTASAGSGWVYADYSASGVTLPAGRNLIPAVWTAGGSLWRSYSIPFWGSGGISGSALALGANGLGNGPLSAPSTVGGTPLQGAFEGPNTAWAFPGNWDAPENDWVDLEVQLALPGSGLLMAAGVP